MSALGLGGGMHCTESHSGSVCKCLKGTESFQLVQRITSTRSLTRAAMAATMAGPSESVSVFLPDRLRLLEM